MLRSIRAQGAQRLYVERMAFLEQLLQGLGHRHQGMERQQICHQVIILNKLTLLVALYLNRRLRPFILV
jgi:hypothetical protein